VLGQVQKTFLPNGASWSWVDELIPVTSTVLAPNDYLRLDFGCTSETGEGCHIHYDVQKDFPSSLMVVVQ
jgi:hypothetical protein